MTAIRLDHVGHCFGKTAALADVSLEIEAGELFFLLGPSGCGKSTLLRIIAGLLQPTAGRVWFGTRDVTTVGTEGRNAVMVFQSYALWPHMTVRENVRFGLSVRGMSRTDQDRRINEVLALVQMDSLAQRKPNELSGGQQQRVALARAIAVKPDYLLLDEPLSNLDAKLRQEMRGEIRRICKLAGLTTIYVTHDQKEALSIADRIAVLKDGSLIQVGTPAELYHRPATAFVADFIGQTNLFRGEILGRDGAWTTIQTPLGVIKARAAAQQGEQVVVSIRPEMMRLKRSGSADMNCIGGRVVEMTFLGEASEHVVEVGGTRVRVISLPPVFDLSGEVMVEFAPEDVVVLGGG